VLSSDQWLWAKIILGQRRRVPEAPVRPLKKTRLDVEMRMSILGKQPTIITSDNQRRFACSPVAILVFIVNEHEEILMLAHPKRDGDWEVVNGALEARETIIDGALRETREEAGNEVKVQPLGTVHVSTFHYDENVNYMLSVGYLMDYKGGEIQPGDDMAGSKFKWWKLEELADESVKVLIPPDGKWILERAVELYRIWKVKEMELQLQPDMTIPLTTKPK